MTWLKLDDGFPEHKRVDLLSVFAFRLHVTALCFCAKHLTDGLLRDKDVKVILVRSGAKSKHVRELVDVGLWVEIADEHWVRDYLDYNPSSEQVKDERERTAERQRKWRQSRNAVTDTVSNGVTNAAPSHPIPYITTPPPSLSDSDQGREGGKILREMPT